MPFFKYLLRIPLSRGDLLLDDSLFRFGPLSGCVGLSTLQYTAHDFTGVDILECVSARLLEDAHFLGCCVRVIGERDEGRRSVVNGTWGAKREVFEIWLIGAKRGREYHSMDVLYQ